jgi:hypothetical protein
MGPAFFQLSNIQVTDDLDAFGNGLLCDSNIVVFNVVRQRFWPVQLTNAIYTERVIVELT